MSGVEGVEIMGLLGVVVTGLRWKIIDVLSV